MESVAQTELEEARRRSREKSHEEALAVLLLLLGRKPTVRRTPRTAEDISRTHVAARSYSSTWAARLLVASRKAAANDLPPRTILDTTDSLDAVIRRSLVNETVDSWNVERFDLGAELTEYAPILEQEWVAILDGVTCAHCKAMDGQRAPLGKVFSGGGTPPLHPFCRCFIDIVPREQAHSLAKAS